MDKFTWICLILFFGDIFSNKLFYKNHFVKQNSDLVNITFSMENTKDGMLVNYYEELKIRLDFVWVINTSFSKAHFRSLVAFNFLTLLKYLLLKVKFIYGISNPIAPGKYMTIVNTTTDLCDMFEAKNNFIKKLLFNKFENATNVKLKCPIEKIVFHIDNWILDSREFIPKSLLLIPNNFSLYIEFVVATKPSVKREFLYSLKILFELK
jgi:hypothetical protein